jgi:hypothetical protein
MTGGLIWGGGFAQCRQPLPRHQYQRSKQAQAERDAQTAEARARMQVGSQGGPMGGGRLDCYPWALVKRDVVVHAAWVSLS